MSSTGTITPETAEARRLVEAVPHWHHRMEVVAGVVSPGSYDPSPMLDAMRLPERLDGKRALDIGCNDGFFSFALEARGAEVVAVDAAPTPGFALTHRLRGSSVEHVRDSVYDLTPERHGRFDIVLFLGVLYHLRHPLLAVNVISTLCRETLVVESHGLDAGFVLPDGRMVAIDDPRFQIMQFYPGRELNGDATNWWAPTLSCLAAMVETANMRVRSAGQWISGRLLVVAEPAPETEPVHYPSGSRFGDASCYFPPGVAPPPAAG